MATHQVRRLVKDILQCVVGLLCWAEAVDESPIATSIFGTESEARQRLSPVPGVVGGWFLANLTVRAWRQRDF